jgi:hypothetical protein
MPGSCDTELVIGARVAQHLDNAIGRQRHFNKAHGEGRKRILDGRDDRCRRRNGAAFAAPLTPSGLSGLGVSTCSIVQLGTSGAVGKR